MNNETRAALERLADAMENDPRPAGGVWASDIRKILAAAQADAVSDEQLWALRGLAAYNAVDETKDEFIARARAALTSNPAVEPQASAQVGEAIRYLRDRVSANRATGGTAIMLGLDVCETLLSTLSTAKPQASAQVGEVDTDAVAEVVECSTMGGPTLREIDGRWKFLKAGEKLYRMGAPYVRGYQDGRAEAYNVNYGLSAQPQASAQVGEVKTHPAEIRFMNLELDIRRVIGWEKPINDFDVVAELQAYIAQMAESTAQPQADAGVSDETLNDVILGIKKFTKLEDARNHIRAVLALRPAAAKDAGEVKGLSAEFMTAHAQGAAAEAPAQRKPLTDERIVMHGIMLVPGKIEDCTEWFIRGVRFAEEEHGIAAATGEKPE